eukprot:TRINITY_DN3098_c0_g2_i1.p1 TRINITY_DN3098_c0_g2~~TRINITY_DN3098_c0_g2_i1.p1  ORF type:complete len:1559 (-),score=660.25 TRINITY_DN3098_c0_g2_i1:88-4764(-)
MKIPLMQEWLDFMTQSRLARFTLKWWIKKEKLVAETNKTEKEVKNTMVEKLLSYSPSAIYLKFVWRHLVRERQDLLDQFINAKKSFRGVFFEEHAERAFVKKITGAQNEAPKREVPKRAPRRAISGKRKAQKKGSDANVSATLSQQKNQEVAMKKEISDEGEDVDHEDFFIIEACHGLWRLLPRQSEALAQQWALQALNASRGIPERVKAIQRWTLMPTINYNDVVEFMEKNENARTLENGTTTKPLPVNLIESLLRGTLRTDEPPAALNYLLSPKFLASDRARVGIYSIGRVIPYQPSNGLSEIFKSILTGEQRKSLKVTVHKELIRLMARMATDEYLNIITAEWARKDLHRDVRVAIIWEAIHFLHFNSPKPLRVGWDILKSCTQLQEPEVLVHLLKAGSSSGRFDNVSSCLQNVRMREALKSETTKQLEKDKVPKSHQEEYSRDVLIPLARDSQNEDIKILAIVSLRDARPFGKEEYLNIISDYVTSFPSTCLLFSTKPSEIRIFKARYANALETVVDISLIPKEKNQVFFNQIIEKSLDFIKTLPPTSHTAKKALFESVEASVSSLSDKDIALPNESQLVDVLNGFNKDLFWQLIQTRKIKFNKTYTAERYLAQVKELCSHANEDDETVEWVIGQIKSINQPEAVGALSEIAELALNSSTHPVTKTIIVKSFWKLVSKYPTWGTWNPELTIKMLDECVLFAVPKNMAVAGIPSFLQEVAEGMSRLLACPKTYGNFTITVPKTTAHSTFSLADNSGLEFQTERGYPQTLFGLVPFTSREFKEKQFIQEPTSNSFSSIFNTTYSKTVGAVGHDAIVETLLVRFINSVNADNAPSVFNGAPAPAVASEESRFHGTFAHYIISRLIDADPSLIVFTIEKNQDKYNAVIQTILGNLAQLLVDNEKTFVTTNSSTISGVKSQVLGFIKAIAKQDGVDAFNATINWLVSTFLALSKENPRKKAIYKEVAIHVIISSPEWTRQPQNRDTLIQLIDHLIGGTDIQTLSKTDNVSDAHSLVWLSIQTIHHKASEGSSAKITVGVSEESAQLLKSVSEIAIKYALQDSTKTRAQSFLSRLIQSLALPIALVNLTSVADALIKSIESSLADPKRTTVPEEFNSLETLLDALVTKSEINGDISEWRGLLSKINAIKATCDSSAKEAVLLKKLVLLEKHSRYLFFEEGAHDLRGLVNETISLSGESSSPHLNAIRQALSNAHKAKRAIFGPAKEGVDKAFRASLMSVFEPFIRISDETFYKSNTTHLLRKDLISNLLDADRDIASANLPLGDIVALTKALIKVSSEKSFFKLRDVTVSAIKNFVAVWERANADIEDAEYAKTIKEFEVKSETDKTLKRPKRRIIPLSENTLALIKEIISLAESNSSTPISSVCLKALRDLIGANPRLFLFKEQRETGFKVLNWAIVRAVSTNSLPPLEELVNQIVATLTNSKSSGGGLEGAGLDELVVDEMALHVISPLIQQDWSQAVVPSHEKQIVSALAKNRLELRARNVALDLLIPLAKASAFKTSQGSSEWLPPFSAIFFKLVVEETNGHLHRKLLSTDPNEAI